MVEIYIYYECDINSFLNIKINAYQLSLHLLEVYWPNCITENKKLIGGVKIDSEVTQVKIKDYENCSTTCYKDPCCHFWNFDSSKFNCTHLKKNNTDSEAIEERPEQFVYFGTRDCFGNGNS